MRRRSPTEITPGLLRGWPLPRPDGSRGKEGRGQVCVIGGCVEVPGAVLLASLAALRVGVGRLQIATVRSVAPLIGVAIPESRVMGLLQRPNGELAPLGGQRALRDLEENDAILLGPGMGPTTDAAARALLRACHARAKAATVVLDAGGLLAISRGARRSVGSIIATPHAGEMARLWGLAPSEVRARPLEIAREASLHLGIIVVVKGPKTYVATPSGQIFVNTAGNVGLGTSGSGDVLAGAMAGLCARGATPEQAAVWAVHLHARAGERLSRRIGPLGFYARELLDELPSLMARMAV